MMNNVKVIKESARGFEPLALEDLLFEGREIWFTDEVNANTCTELIKQLLYLDRQSHDEIILYINSGGGEVRSGLAVYDCIRLMESPVTTVCSGIAASMGSIFFLAGDKRIILPNSTVMIHDPSYGGGSYAGKKPDQLEAELDSLKDLREKLLGIISERTGREIDEIREKTKTDTYFSAEEALGFGLATEVASKINFKKGGSNND